MKVANLVSPSATRWARCRSLYAATDGPRRRRVRRPGRHRRAARPPEARRDVRAARATRTTARRLWEVSEELTGVHYDFARAGVKA